MSSWPFSLEPCCSSPGSGRGGRWRCERGDTEVRPLTGSGLGGRTRFALGAAGTATIVIIVVVLTSSNGGSKRLPPPARLPALVQTYANASIGVTGGLPHDWSAVRGPGFIQLASRDRKALIVIAAQNVAPGRKAPLLRTALAAIRKTYGAVTVKHGVGTKLGGLPARSVVAYTRNRRNVPIRVLVAAAQAPRLAYLLEAFTARAASVHDLAETQEVVLDLRLRG